MTKIKAFFKNSQDKWYFMPMIGIPVLILAIGIILLINTAKNSPDQPETPTEPSPTQSPSPTESASPSPEELSPTARVSVRPSPSKTPTAGPSNTPQPGPTNTPQPEPTSTPQPTATSIPATPTSHQITCSGAGGTCQTIASCESSGGNNVGALNCNEPQICCISGPQP